MSVGAGFHKNWDSLTKLRTGIYQSTKIEINTFHRFIGRIAYICPYALWARLIASNTKHHEEVVCFAVTVFLVDAAKPG